MLFRALLVALFIGLALATEIDDGSDDGNDDDGDAGSGTINTSSPPFLVDHGGMTLPTANLHILFVNDFDADDTIFSHVSDFVTGVNNSPYFDILAQYFPSGSIPQAQIVQHSKTTTQYNLSCEDPSPAVNHALCALSPQNHDIGVFFTSESRPSNCGACGWHSYLNCGPGVNLFVIFVYNLGGDEGCNVVGRASPQVLPEPAGSIINVFSHEMFETMSDPYLNAWYSADGEEVGDICAWHFGAPITLTNSNNEQVQFNVQYEFDDRISACGYGEGFSALATSQPSALATSPQPTNSPIVTDIACNHNELIKGIYGRRDSWFDQLGVVCWDPEQNITRFGPVSGTSATGSAFIMECPSQQLVSQLTTYTSGSNTVVALQVTCRDIDDATVWETFSTGNENLTATSNDYACPSQFGQAIHLSSPNKDGASNPLGMTCQDLANSPSSLSFNPIVVGAATGGAFLALIGVLAIVFTTRRRTLNIKTSWVVKLETPTFATSLA